MGCVYCVTCKINSKKYIGKTICNISKRKKEHEGNTHKEKGFIFHRALRKYGIENFDWEILFESSNNEILNRIEIDFIREENTKKPNGYNMTDGGEGSATNTGRVFSEEWKSNISKGGIGHASYENQVKYAILPKTKKHKLAISKALTGRVFSKEHLKNMSLCQLGRIKGKTYEEMYGEEKAKKMKEKKRKLAIENPNFSFSGRKHTEESKKKMRKNSKKQKE